MNRKIGICKYCSGEVKMRRSDREVKEFEDIVAIMEKCDVCRIALNNNGYPYILPLNLCAHKGQSKSA